MKTITLKKQILTLAIISIISAFQIQAQNDSIYLLPIASDTTLGGIKIGSGLKIDGTTGILSADNIPDMPIEQQNNNLISTSLNAGVNFRGTDAIILGANAGNSSEGGYSNMVGYYAGAENNNSVCSNMIGYYAGYRASSVVANNYGYNNFIGYKAGYEATGGTNNFIGYEAGYMSKGNNTGAVFIGRYAGKNSNSTTGVVFMGGSSGENSQNIKNSIFLAPSAGYHAINVTCGVYLGHKAGYYTNSSHCILIGENAGRSLGAGDKISDNNIILGNGTTLPNAARNSFNIGNVLYGTDIQASSGNYPTFTPRPNGRVGIGVIAPQANLHVKGTMLVNGNVEFGNTGNTWLKIQSDKNMRVNGTITAMEINVKTDVWADHVFEENYQLTPLEEVECFVKENKHLSEIPSAGEVLENGIDLAQMNVTLLKKVEELTLYVIELNKEIQELKSNK